MQPFPSQKVLFVDNSLIELITTCPWKAYTSVIRKRRLAGENPALRQGSHVHAALAYRYKQLAYGKTPSLDVENRILTKRYEKTPCEAEEWRNLDMASNALRAYNENYPFEPFEVVRYGPHNLPFVERPFAVELPEVIEGVRIFYVGRIDLLVLTAQGLFVMDHKTSSMLGASYWRDAQMSEQQRGYCWAVKQLLGEEPLGYTINVLALRKPSKTGKSIEFVRQNFFTAEPPGQLDEWYHNMLSQVRTFLWHWHNDLWPRHHSNHCEGKFGTCPFFHVCELPPASREAALMSAAYEENSWTPLYR